MIKPEYYNESNSRDTASLLAVPFQGCSSFFIQLLTNREQSYFFFFRCFTLTYSLSELEIAAVVCKKRPEDEEEEDGEEENGLDYTHSLDNRKSFADLVPAEYTSAEVGNSNVIFDLQFFFIVQTFKKNFFMDFSYFCSFVHLHSLRSSDHF